MYGSYVKLLLVGYFEGVDSERALGIPDEREKRKDVKLYIKLPSWFTVATPIGAYNPDWAIVMEDPDGGDDLLYLVRETKGRARHRRVAPGREAQDSVRTETFPGHVGDGLNRLPCNYRGRAVTGRRRVISRYQWNSHIGTMTP